MKFSADRLAQWLEAALGADAVTGKPALLAAHLVDGKEPALLIFPASAEQVSAALRVCCEAEATVAPWGGGTAMGIGNPPRQIDVVVGLERLNRLVEHDQANLTATIQSGHRLANLQEILKRQNQFLPFDPPAPARATVGGVVVTNLNGPRRSYYGSVRDLVIGMKVVLASGAEIKAGGKVVKNVAGYDMCKLFVGSLGTLGIITEATLRMAPIPETAATVVASGTLGEAQQFMNELSRSKLLPSVVFLLSPEASNAADRKQNQWRVAVWCEGFEKSVARHLHEAQHTAAGIGLGTEILQANDHNGFWDEVRDFSLQANRLIYRVTVPRASATAVIQAVHNFSTAGFRPAIVSDLLMGTLWISLAANDEAVKWFTKLCTETREYRGHAILLAAPAELKQGVDVWGPAPPGLSLMRDIKRQFDPKSLLNPGRFLGGI
jgi:glycolate oxidase FAD binding subunit